MIREREDNLKEDLVKHSGRRNDKEPPATNRYYKQQYRKAWEQLPEFNGWLEGVSDNTSLAFCKVCNRNLHAHRLTLLKHTISIKHMKLAQEQFKAKQLEDAKARERLSNQKTVCIEVDVNPNDIETRSSGDNSTVNDKTNDPLSIQSDGNQSVIKPEGVNITNDNNTYKSNTPPPQPLVELSPITTHVLDTSKGLPVTGLPVSIYQLIEGRWTYINEAHTNPDGRCTNLITKDNLKPGRYKLHFDTDKYFELRNNDRLFPFIEIAFDVRSPVDHLHIPLLMSPYGYTTYKGS